MSSANDRKQSLRSGTKLVKYTGTQTHAKDDDVRDVDDEKSQAEGTAHVSSTTPPKKASARLSSTKSSGKATKLDSVVKLDKSKSKDRMVNLATRGVTGIRQDLRPLSNIGDIFADLTQNALMHGLQGVVQGEGNAGSANRPLRVATMCSGTECPLLAIGMVREALRTAKHSDIAFEHVFSAKIEPFKQAYIERNFMPSIIFRDITEITQSQDGKATTAYGAMVDIPSDIDILIAGTACVDFSALNAMKKDLSDSGESGDTFYAVRDYAARYRPKVLILENVYGAPWDRMIKNYEMIDYAAAGVLVDTKDFYLPQTRNRGYMCCVDEKVSFSKTESVEVVRHWEESMKQLRRPASAPISSFLLPDDDGDVVLARDRLSRQSALDSTLRETAWSKSEGRHEKFRTEHQLGNRRPYTSWQPSGALVLYDYADRAWHRRQVERIWDFEECALLHKAVNHDVQFKERDWNVSQNIDRHKDNGPFGLAPCLTPSGIFYLTSRGGPLTFAESLLLQGIPSERLMFASETARQIQDLAGNAMSSPVVGAAILAALISAGPTLFKAKTGTTGQSSSQVCAVPKALSRIDIKGLKGPESVLDSINVINVEVLIKHATQAARMCYCEGQVGVSENRIQKCVECGHTTCVICGVKPTHHYQALDAEHNLRRTPDSFIQYWRSILPMQLKLHVADDASVDHISDAIRENVVQTKISVDDYITAVERAVTSEFRFERFRRSTNWTVIYRARYAKLILTVRFDGLRWALYAVPDTELPGNNALRLFLQQPIARSSLDRKDFFPTRWEWRIPEDISFNLNITATGKLVPSWTARLGIVTEQDRSMASSLRIAAVQPIPDLREDPAGDYTYLGNCGTASESLYRKNQGNDSLYLFLDPMPVGPGDNDSFVFSQDPKRLQSDETRDVIAWIEPKWRPWNKEEITNSSKNSEKFSSAIGRTNSRWISIPQVILSLRGAKS